ncbi:hypothetical protein [Sphingobacterium suaedae]|uniref:DUF4252 domain-containing protein n=1 Tax=Sphingobacterium suaedae TaxID=1686402 RepID=A0ABW5KHT5_9SPHI
MSRTLIIFFLIPFFATTGNAQTSSVQETDIKRIQAFIRDIADPAIRADIILSQHVLIEETDTHEGYDYLEASIEEIRVNLQTKNINDIHYIPFHELPKRETRDIDPEGKPTNRMYFLQYKNRQMLAIYVAQDKIASFTLVSKGDKIAHFVTY